MTRRALGGGPCSIEGVGRGLQEAVGTARGVAPQGVECPDTSTDRWSWALGAQEVFQVGDPSTLGPRNLGTAP